VSDLPAEALTYETLVAEYFLGLRGAGLMLSPLDVEQVRAWKLRGLPVPVVCRGLRFGWERAVAALAPGAAPPRSLRALRHTVEDEWRAYRSARCAPGEGGDASALVAARAAEAVRRLRAAERAAAGALAEAHARGAAAVEAAAATGSPDALEAALAAADDGALRAWARALAAEARAAAGRFCATRAGSRAPGCSRAAHREALRAHARDFARGAGLTLVAGSV
jgi:hypothetical protein